MCSPFTTSSATIISTILVVVSILVAISRAKMARLHTGSTNIIIMPNQSTLVRQMRLARELSVAMIYGTVAAGAVQSAQMCIRDSHRDDGGHGHENAHIGGRGMGRSGIL